MQLNTKVTGGNVNSDNVEVYMESVDGKTMDSMTASKVLISTGRVPYTEGLGLENIGVKVNDWGQIPVDGHLKTAASNIFAIGDVIEGPMLAHKAEEEGIAAVETLAGVGGHVNYDAIPGVVYTHPEIASVGLTEEQLKAEGVKYNKGTFPFMANSRARANLDTDGMIKILTDKETDKMLGVHIIGS